MTFKPFTLKRPASDYSLFRACSNPIEMFERRLFLSITGVSIYGPYTKAGTQWTYSTSDNTGTVGTYAQKVIGPATFNGQSASEVDTGDGTSFNVKSYVGLDSAGDIVDYGDTSTGDNSNSYNDTYSPYQIVIPGNMVAGVPYSSTSTETDVNDSSTGTTTDTSDDAVTLTLASETPTPLTVPAGTYNVYQITDAETDTDTDAGSSGNTTFDDTYYFANGVGLVKSVDQDGDTFTLASFNGGGQLAFTGQPSDVSANDNFKTPVKVAVEDKDGDVSTTDNTTVVTLTAVGGAANNQIINNTATAVDGIAIFSDLQLSAPGTYTLSAKDAADTGATSSSFNVSGFHLSFAKQPSDANAGDPLLFDLQLLDSQNKVDTTDSTDSVQYSLTNVQTGAVTVLSPNLQLNAGENDRSTAALAGDQLLANTAGTFTLTAQEIDASSGTADMSTGSAVSSKFTITGDHLVFKKQPANADANVSIPFVVDLEDAKNKIVTTENSNSVQFTINSVTTGVSNVFGSIVLLGGVITAPTGPDGLQISQPGNYTLTATETQPDGTVISATMAATSKQFTVTGDHLNFKKQPADADTDQPIRFTVELVDAKNKLVASENTNQVVYTATSLASNEVGALGNAATLVNGTDNEQDLPAGSALSVAIPGTYTLTATEIMPDGTNVDSTLPATSQTFKVNGLHLVFSRQPANTSVNEPIKFIVKLEDSKNKVVTTESTNQVQYQLITGGSAGTLSGPSLVTLQSGVDNELNNAGAGALSVSISGTFTLSATEYKPDGTLVDTTEMATSKAFIISNDHLMFTKKPGTSEVDQPIAFAVALLDEKNKSVDDNTDNLAITIGGSAAGATLGTPSQVPLTAGIYDNSTAGSSAITIAVPGTYTLSISEVDADGASVDSTDSISSLPFNVQGFHLVFVSQPSEKTTTSPLSFKVELKNSSNKIVDESTADLLNYTLNPVADTNNTTLMGQTTAPIVSGVDENSARTTVNQLSIAVAGTYTLSVKEVAPDGTLISITLPATSKKFVIGD